MLAGDNAATSRYIEFLSSGSSDYAINLLKKAGAVNPSFTFENVPLRHGRIVENIGWVADDYLGIDQGPIVAMIENYRSELIWKLMQRSPYVRRGLERAGFTGGWLAQPPQAQPSS